MEQAPVLVSVIMPAYNVAAYVAEAIQSVVAQTYPHWELIVVDDGSVDETANIVRGYATGDDRIKYLHQENGRQGKARNTGIRNARGQLLAFLDADDLWQSEKLELQVPTLQEMKADLVYSNGLIFHSDQPKIEAKTFPIVRGRVEGNSMFDLLLLHNLIPILTVLMRKETFADAGPFEEALQYQGCEDYDLWLKAARHGAVFYGMPEKLVRYRRHATASTKRDSGWLKPMLRVLRRHLDDGRLSEAEKTARMKGLYRDLISALLNEGNVPEAREYMAELAGWDKSGPVTSIQKILMRLSPGIFNFVSKNCFYRVEWHLRTLRKKKP
jgi:glycosyltransferase involved in cell wall biosynthesis